VMQDRISFCVIFLYVSMAPREALRCGTSAWFARDTALCMVRVHLRSRSNFEELGVS
jgi:hypothetical protein